MEHETAGDPVSGCKWTRKTTGKIAQQLKRAGIRVSAKTVGRLLKQMNYSLRLNLKCLESGQSKPPDPRQRDLQFRYIRSRIRIYKANAMPVISVDTKSRELIGPFHQAGRKWSQEPTKVLDHDFPSDSNGVAIPYGIYDIIQNEGFVYVGTRRDTSEFAVDSIRTWWLMICFSSGTRSIVPSIAKRLLPYHISNKNWCSSVGACDHWVQQMLRILIFPWLLRAEQNPSDQEVPISKSSIIFLHFHRV